MTPQHYPIEPGTLFGGEYPGDRNPELAKARIRNLVKIGVRTFIDLTTSADQMASYEVLLEGIGSETGVALRRISLPINDMGVPESDEIMRAIMNAVRNSLDSAPAVYIHCWGGIGRAGTVAGCWLRERGLDPDSALARVQLLYSSHMPKVRIYPESPQTPAQKNLVRRWRPESDLPSAGCPTCRGRSR